mmetsp:Transcript_35646/g.76112  ORF Transcript_35646/g.76112 Transcript_35646/m.76112 type:complete len:328 (+) Transcript_35646:23-1006(+)
MDLLRSYFLTSRPTVVTNEDFFQELRRNSSIRKLTLVHCDLADETDRVGHEIRKSFYANGDFLPPKDLTHVRLEGASCLRASTVRKHRDVDDFLKSLVEAIRGKHRLTRLELVGIGIGVNGCETLASLLQDPKCNLVSLDLAGNTIDDASATVLAGALKNNSKLESLTFPTRNAMTEKGWTEFSKALCDTSSISDIYFSNHTMKYLGDQPPPSRHLKLSSPSCDDALKKQIAMKKILRHHHHFDMEPLFVWGMKMMPIAVGWFDRAKVCAGKNECVDVKKLDAIYQFIHAMPEIIEPACVKKRSSESEMKCTSMSLLDFGRYFVSVR